MRTLAALLLGAVLAGGCDTAAVAVDKQRESEAEDARLKAEEAARRAADEARKAAADAEEKVAKLTKEAIDLGAQVDAAVAAVAAAQNEADRSAATAKLRELRRQQFDFEQRIAAAKAAAARATRMKGVHISKECMDNPLAKGCS